MKIKVLAMAIGILALFMICSCAKKEEQSEAKNNGLKRLEDLQSSGSSDVDTDAFREQASKQSGNRVNEKIKEAESAKNKDKKDGSSGNDKSGDNKDNAGKIADSMVESEGSYADALTKKELTETLKIAASYVNKKYNLRIKASKLKPASDKSKEYTKYPLYGVGNIIIYELENEGKTIYVAVGRLDSKSDWKVLNK